jgi:hypothetical protein
MTRSHLLNKSWRQRIFLFLTIIITVMLIGHPELRLFLPLLDALGLELLLIILSTQIIAFVKPVLKAFVRRIARPLARRLYALVLFFFGFAGPYVDAWVNSLIGSHKALARATP